MKISLSNLDWQVKGYWPWVPIKENSMETGQQLHGVTPFIPARVPGGVHYDLFQAGYITNPYYGLDSLKCEWVENRWWMYRTVFENPHPDENRKTELIFEGVDYEVLVYVNDCFMAEHKGMYEPLKIDITNVLQEKNKLVVIFKGIPQEMGQIGYTSKTSTQKSRFNYKWDFSTRLVNIGFWQDVKLKVYEEVELQEIYVHSDVEQGKGTITVDAVLNQEKLQPSMVQLQLLEPVSNQCIYFNNFLIGSEGNERGISDRLYDTTTDISYKTIEKTTDRIYTNKIHDKITVDQPMLWYPNGSGSQPLYTVKLLVIKKDHQSSPLYCQKVGIRSLAYGHNENEHENALPYTFIINGRKTYIKGVNITPIDHIYGNITKEQYEFLVDCAVNANVNMIRVWGGGLIEKEWLYDLCDKKGILIWQEFIQSSSGIDNIPSTDPDFLQLLKKNSISAIKQKRNHVSLTVWSGGNELMEEPDRPCGYENENIAMLKTLVEQYDPQRMFLPTSSSGPREFISFEKGVSHDVHGSWRYEGNPRHYRMYGSSDNLFHSEFGLDGTASVKSLKKFLPEDAWYPTPMSGNLNWQHHGEWWGTYGRDTEIFGTITDLEYFVQCSQYMQMEGLRFIIEANRRRKFQNSGCIIWQLNEPWPNASCTNLVDYYGEAKPAYYMVKKVYSPIHISMSYQKLDYQLGEMFQETITVHNSMDTFEGDIQVKIRNMNGDCVTEYLYHGLFPANRATDATELKFQIKDVSEIFFVELKIVVMEQIVSENVYMFALQKEHLFEPLKKVRTEVICEELEQKKEIAQVQELERKQKDNDNVIVKKVRIKNIGSEVAVHAGVELKEDGYWILGNDNYVFLFPQEEKILEFEIRKKKTGTFQSNENLPESDLGIPTMKAVWFGCNS